MYNISSSLCEIIKFIYCRFFFTVVNGHVAIIVVDVAGQNISVPEVGSPAIPSGARRREVRALISPFALSPSGYERRAEYGVLNV